VQLVRSIAMDCDSDALLVRVEQVGSACHNGTRSCFDTALVYSTTARPEEPHRG
ncbi:MAG: phosphoribosyl-AMP cyclohydrolase, partial [Microbacteriaceae bacterium]|nr:phosphoribosyl-AMP cyclohydrolase [Microbacteriaceae bacterium]